MNVAEMIAPNSPIGPPVDALDIVIATLDQVLPVYSDRLELGVNTRYCRALARVLSTHAQDVSLTTQNTRRKQIVPATPQLSALKDASLKAARQIDALHQQEDGVENVNEAGRRFLVGVAKGHIGELQSAIARLESLCGAFHIWIKQPTRALYGSLIKAWEKGESDSEEFLAWFRKDQLGLLGRELDPYIAQILLGMHVSAGQILFLGETRNLADLNEGLKDENLAGRSDAEIREGIIRRASTLKRADESTRVDRRRHRENVYPPGEKKNGRRFDAMTHAVSLDGLLFIGEIGGLFAANSLATQTVMQAAIVEALAREDFERLFRKVGLDRERARFTARVLSGRARWSDDPAAAKAVREKKTAIVQAMKADRVFGQLLEDLPCRPCPRRRGRGQG
jgi:hypothetical protein